MNEREKQRLIDDYLGRLARALGDVPADVRRELVEDVRGHVEEAWAQSAQRDHATLLNILARVGEPEALAREERERLGLARPPEQAGPDLLSVAAIVFTVVFWPVGIILAWLSPRWSAGDKAVVTLLPVLGLLLALSLSFAATTFYQQGPAVTHVTTVERGAAPTTTPEVERPTPQPGFASGLWAAALRALVFYGILGAPLTAAAFLALRLRPYRHAARVLLAATGGVFAVFLLLVAFLIPG